MIKRNNNIKIFNLNDTKEAIEVFNHFKVDKNYLIENYKKKIFKSFVNEAKNFFGSWLIIDFAKKRIVTSPSFCGAYWDIENNIISSSLGPIVKNRIKLRNKIIDNGNLLSEIYSETQAGSFELPVSTIFKNVFKIPPCVYSDKFDFYSLKSYLINDGKFFKEETFINEAQNLSNKIYNNYKKVNLLFSGGIDSLILLSFLREVYTSDNLTISYVDQPISGGHINQAIKITKKLGVKLKIEKPNFDWEFASSEKFEELTNLFSQNIVSPFHPFHAIKNENNETLLIDGQNMDGLFLGKMSKENSFKISKFFRIFKQFIKDSSSIDGVYNHNYLRFMNNFLTNLIYDKKLVLKKIDKNLFALKTLQHQPFDKESYLKDLSIVKNRFNFEPNFRNIFFYYYPFLNLINSTEFSSLNGGCLRFASQNDFIDLWSSKLGFKNMFAKKNFFKKYINRNLKIDFEKIDFEKTNYKTLDISKKDVILNSLKVLSDGSSKIYNFCDEETALTLKDYFKKIELQKVIKKSLYPKIMKFYNYDCLLR